MNSKQTLSREEYRRLENRVTCILQQRWPANEISQWVGILQDKQKAVACAILRRRHPRPASLTLPAIAAEVQNPFQARVNSPTVPVRSTDGRPMGRRHLVEGLTPEVIDQDDTIRCANTGAAEQLNLRHKPVLYQIVTSHRPIEAGEKS